MNDSDERNVWGTLKADVGEGYCVDCEREEPWHYDNCPTRQPSATTKGQS